MNMRPVRLEPCAPGASPTMSTCACRSPKPGTGLPHTPNPGKRAVSLWHLFTPFHQARASPAGNYFLVIEHPGTLILPYSINIASPNEKKRYFSSIAAW